MMEYSEETGLACQRCSEEDVSGSITKEGKIACSKCMSARRDPWLWETYEGIGDVQATPEVRPNPQYEGTTPRPKKEGVGMFESDLSEVSMGGGTMRGGWQLPYARGGFAHTPRVIGARGSKYNPVGWERIRGYAQRPENRGKTIAEIAKDLGHSQATVSNYLAGGEGRTTWSKQHPELPRIEPRWTPRGQTRRDISVRFGETGAHWTKDEREEAFSKLAEAFKERLDNETTTMEDIAKELAEDWNIPVRQVKDVLVAKGVWDYARSTREKAGRKTETHLAKAGVTESDIVDYLEVFGGEASDETISKALKVSQSNIRKARVRMGMKGYREGEDERVKYYIIDQYEHMDADQMADALNVSKAVVQRHMRELGFVRGRLT